MPAETLSIGDAVTVQVIRAASSNVAGSIIILTLFVAFMVGLVFYLKRR